ncbi:MAG: CPBP family intramembrane metalloprotease [Steroidobacteraceae bacterium]|nr:CPBP family intramembrane metalloprotease [Steroidobacteraceae bacterium]
MPSSVTSAATWNAPRLASLLEAGAFCVLILSYIWGWQDAFPGASAVVIGLYFGLGLYGHARRGESLRQIGLRLDNFRAALRNASLVVAPAIVLALLIGTAMGSWHFRPLDETVLNLPYATAWGTAQQYGLLCVLYRRFAELFQSHRAATAAASLAFAIFHIPNTFLVGVTLLAGWAACVLYRREPNVWALGIAHAAVSLFIYYALPFDVTHGLRVGPGYLAMQ